MVRKPIAKPRPPSPDQPATGKERRRGRGSRSNLTGRFETQLREDFDDGWESLAELAPFKTEVRIEQARQIISTNDSPDIGFDQSINPYRGCEHGCIYCFARPTHCYLGLSAGLEFETMLIAKTNTAALLEQELARPGYRVKTIALGTNTDPYQPIEKTHELTRRILEIMDRTNHPVGIVTKSALVLARHRHPRLAGQARPRQGGALGDLARPSPFAPDGAARARRPSAASRRSPGWRKQACRSA